MDALFDPDRKAGELIEAVDSIQRAIRQKHPEVKYIYIDPESSRDPKHEHRSERFKRAS